MEMIRTLATTVLTRAWQANETSTDELKYAARISVWGRLAILTLALAETNYRVEYGSISQILNTLYLLTAMSINGVAIHRILTGRAVTLRWLFALSIMDVGMVTFSTFLSGGLESRYFAFYYPAIALFAAVFSSTYLNVAWVTLVSILYFLTVIFSMSGVVIGVEEEKILFYRIGALYLVTALVNLVTRMERIKRRESIDRETELQRQRIEISQTIHNSTAQWAYLIGLGIENIKDDLEAPRDELAARLDVTEGLSKTVMWELRRPIDGGQIFEGMELCDVLKGHASTFTVITGVPARLERTGVEPRLSTIDRSLLFSIAHNALTNAYRHAHADDVVVELEFGRDAIRLSVCDNGVGIADGYVGRGHGFRNMEADAERMGGWLEVGSGVDGRGTIVTCVVPQGSQ